MASLRVVYGLGGNEPTRDQEKRWLERVEELIVQGKSEEAAGELAAKEIFSTYGTYKYASQADTIHDLIQTLKKKS
ncbi:MAG: hypothetical protein KAQ98_05660 [Bacteriovoracaceae bacterium]|nr:hypothetical protein [Bacteriovoracaceae bacterium]